MPAEKPPLPKIRKAGLPEAFVKAFEARQPVDNHLWQRPPPGAARGPCPALNTLANHGYLPRNGKNITLAAVIDASFSAWLLLPDMTGLITTRGIVNSDHDLDHQFNLSITGHKSWMMEHDCSFSRLDKKEGDPLPFNNRVWTSSIISLFGNQFFRFFTLQSTLITPRLMAKAKVARLRDPFKQCDYNSIAAAEGALEIGMIISALQENDHPGAAKLSYVRGLIEQEKIVVDDDDKEVEKNSLNGGLSGTLKLAQEALQSSPVMQQTTDAGKMSTIDDILRALKPTDTGAVIQLRDLIVRVLGYPASMVLSLDKLIEKGMSQPPPGFAGFGPPGFGPPGFGPPGFGPPGFGPPGFGPPQGFPPQGFPPQGFPPQGFPRPSPPRFPQGPPRKGQPQNTQQRGRPAQRPSKGK